MKNLITTHEVCIELIEAITLFETFKKTRQESLEGVAGTFIAFRRKYTHDIEIYSMCIERLNLRYAKQIAKCVLPI